MGKQLQQQRWKNFRHHFVNIYKNANYNILVEDLAEKLILQERRIGELERKCNISNDFLSEEYTKKSTSAENLENYYDAKRVDSKISTS